MESFGVGGKCLSRPAQRTRVGAWIVRYSSGEARSLVAGASLGDEGPDLGATEGVPESARSSGEEADAAGEEGPLRPTEDRPGRRRRITRFQPNRRRTRISQDVASSH